MRTGSLNFVLFVGADYKCNANLMQQLSPHVHNGANFSQVKAKNSAVGNQWTTSHTLLILFMLGHPPQNSVEIHRFKI